ELLDYVIEYHFPELWKKFDAKTLAVTQNQSGDNSTMATKSKMYQEWFQLVVSQTVQTLCEWMCVGFVHGVLNTDNMSILGLTIDYGPFGNVSLIFVYIRIYTFFYLLFFIFAKGMMEYFDRKYVSNTSDTYGRYAYDQQVNIVKWNLLQLGFALSNHPSSQSDCHALDVQWMEQYIEQQFDLMYWKYYYSKLQHKFGLVNEDISALIPKFFDALENTRADFTNTFRSLSVLRHSDRSEYVFICLSLDTLENVTVFFLKKNFLCPSENAKNDEMLLHAILENCPSLERYRDLHEKHNADFRRLTKIREYLETNSNTTRLGGATFTDVIEEIKKLERERQKVSEAGQGIIDSKDKLAHDRKAWGAFIDEYRKCVQKRENIDHKKEDQRIQNMNNCNPIYVARNYLIQDAIVQCELNKFDLLHELMEVMTHPFEMSPDANKQQWSKPSPDSCPATTLSCSSLNFFFF
ncbi:UPF0061 domain-containing protein, partial [Reticulomyxa filosa]